MSVETDMKLDDLHMFYSLGCKPLLVRSRSIEGGILTPWVLEKELFTGVCNNQCWSLAMTPNVEGEAFLNKVKVVDALLPPIMSRRQMWYYQTNTH
jgi:hypothetical protein